MSSWLDPVINLDLPALVRRRTDGMLMPNTAKPVEIDGVRYPSMAQARRELHCSYSKLYRLLGESWRYEKRA